MMNKNKSFFILLAFLSLWLLPIFSVQSKELSVPELGSLASQADSTQLFYTVQINSWETEREARADYASYLKQLPADMATYLRIEKISSLYAIRLGRELVKKDIVSQYKLGSSQK